MSPHYVLEVLRAENVAWKSTFHRRTPNLYLKVRLGGNEAKTRIIRRNVSPSWNATLTLPAADSANANDLTVELKHNSRLPRNLCIGSTVVSLDTLLKDRANGEVKLELHLPDARGSSVTTAIICLRIMLVDDRKAAKSQLESVEEHVEQARLADSALGTGVAIAGNIASQMNVQKGLSGCVAELLEKMKGFMDLIDRVATIHPYVNVTWQVTSSLFKAVQGQVIADQEVVGLVRTMKEVFEIIGALDSLEDKLKNIDMTIMECMKQTTECCLFIREYTRRGFLERLVTLGTRQKIEEFKQRFAELKVALTSNTILHNAFVSARIIETVELAYLRQELSPVEMDASSRPQCLAGTRVRVLNGIMGWLFTETDQNMLWLRGVAGSGKSTISMTIAEYCLGMRRRGAYLFFVRGMSDPNTVIRTIAFWLASFDRNIAEHVAAAVKNNNGICMASLESQFEKLILQPLRAVASSLTGPVAIILDALDECGTADKRIQLVKLLRDEFPKLPSAFRFIVTSRPETDIRKAFTHPHVHTVELDYTSTVSRDDVSMYIVHEMRDIFDRSDVPIPQDWEETMTILGEAAEGLFIWASTAVKLVSGSDDPLEELKSLAGYCRSRGSEPHAGNGSGLNKLYGTVLRNSGIRWNKTQSKEHFSHVLGLILLSKAPVTVTAIDGLLGFPSHQILSRLKGILAYTPGIRNTPVRLFHTSFSDYLLSPECGDQDWFIDVADQRQFLAVRCFDVMANELRFNICGLESSFLHNSRVPDLECRTKNKVPSRLEYACRFGAQHLCDTPRFQASPELLSKLTAFVNRHLLYWFEILSLTGHYKRVASRALYDVSLWTSSGPRDITSLLWNAYRFARIFLLPISKGAPHVYISALSFGKSDFTVADRYSRDHPVVPVHTFGTKPTQPCLKVFKGHSSVVLSVVFSPDGRRIAPGSGDKMIRVWDVESAEVISGPFEGHTNYVNSVNFSPDGRCIASGSYDKMIRVWDAESGEVISGPFEGHTGPVLSVTFSPDGARIASGSVDNTIRVWDAESGEVVLGLFEGHTSGVWSVAFSPDGKRMASRSRDETVRIWDTEYTMSHSRMRAECVNNARLRGQIADKDSNPEPRCGSHLDHRTKFSTPNDIDVSWSWIMSKDGWLLGKGGELLIWIPEDIRGTLHRPYNTAIISKFSTKVDFTGCKLGEGWYEGYSREEQG